ncbi:MAG TPA: hypothetical protein VGA36_09030 [Nitriliruptorales bacterium]
MRWRIWTTEWTRAWRDTRTHGTVLAPDYATARNHAADVLRAARWPLAQWSSDTQLAGSEGYEWGVTEEPEEGLT